jgi:S1-C subfamily serine protease
MTFLSRPWLQYGIAALTLLASGHGSLASAVAGERRFERQAEKVEAEILRVKPAIVGIFAEVSAEVTLRCAPHETHVVTLKPEVWNGTGFLIHSDGWIATNGHVVEPVLKDDREYIPGYLRAAADTACGARLARLSEAERNAAIRAIVRDPSNQQGVKLTRKLLVDLPHAPSGNAGASSYPAVVKAYSPSIDPQLLPKDGSKPDPPMLDAAIIKIEAERLPTVRLAPSIDYVHLGQDLFIIGYPGAVLWHDFLSPTSRTEATVTYGRISSFKDDINGRRILQTDAAISWGNSGGPAFNLYDEVIGVATFISTAEDQAIQGFNFLIPVDTIQALARQIGVTPQTDGPFMQEWHAAVDAYFQGRFRSALSHADNANNVVADLRDVHHLRTLLGRLLRNHPWWDAERRTAVVTALVYVAGVVGTILFGAFGVRTIRKRRRMRGAG